MLNRADILQALSQYNDGTLRRLGSVIKDDHASYCRILYTTKGKFLIKQYRMYDKNIEAGLDLVRELKKLNYPTNGLRLTKRRRTYVDIEGNKASLFNFYETKEKFILNKKQIHQLGSYLGKLHAYTLKSKISTKDRFGYNHFDSLIRKHYLARMNTTKEIRELVEYMKKKLPSTKCTRGQPKAANHVEFTPEHVRFKGNKLVHVYDWDEIYRDYCFYDYGTSMIAAFDKNENLDFDKLRCFLQGYEEHRELTTWEKSHLWEALHYGCFKFCTWTLTEPSDDSLVTNYRWAEDINRVKTLMHMDRRAFVKEL